MPLKLVYYGYPHSTYWTGSFKVFFDQRSHISIQSILIKYQYKTFPISSALSRYPRILLIKRALKIDLFFCLTIYEWSLASTILLLPHGINVPDLYFMSSWVNSTPSASGVWLGKVCWNTIWTVGWALSPLLILGWYQAFCVLMFLSGLASLCLWIHSALFCTQGFAIPTNYIFVLRDTDQTLPLHE